MGTVALAHPGPYQKPTDDALDRVYRKLPIINDDINVDLKEGQLQREEGAVTLAVP